MGILFDCCYTHKKEFDDSESESSSNSDMNTQVSKTKKNGKRRLSFENTVDYKIKKKFKESRENYILAAKRRKSYPISDKLEIYNNVLVLQNKNTKKIKNKTKKPRMRLPFLGNLQ